MKPDHTLCLDGIHRLLDGMLGDHMHAKRVQSLANATLGVVRTASLAVHTIGQCLALARGLVTKHAVKQVDRLLSNDGIDIDAILPHWVHHVAGSRTDIKVAMVLECGDIHRQPDQPRRAARDNPRETVEMM
jgi:hypothetical protein